ncbi:MAG: hypothetical protein LBP20_05945 [Treponema sp.]|jgi:hypothetical protein|nr:hypothetical protein [Treponema sp.]
MSNETGAQTPGAQAAPVHSLIPLGDFKAILCLDDREDALSRFCLATATYAIEQYCRRRLYLKRHYERIEFHGDPSSSPRDDVRYTSSLTRRNEGLLLPLREYPVREVLALYGVGDFTWAGELIEPDLYRVIPDLEADTGEGPEDTVYSLLLSPDLNRGISAVKAVYQAGYGCGDPCGVPADLSSACLELAAWNMTRYRGKRIGLAGNVRGSGKDGEHLELSMPENVRLLLEPYRRRAI